MYGSSTQVKQGILQHISIKLLHVLFCLLFAIQPGLAQEKATDDLRKKAQKAATGLHVPAPDLRSPVSMNARTIWSDDKKQLAVIMKVEVLYNWHIYAYVPAGEPYIVSEPRLSAPAGLTPLEKWETPIPYPYADGIFIYKGSLLFIRYFSVKKAVENKIVEVGLYYQTCNMSECLPPELEMIKLTM